MDWLSDWASELDWFAFVSIPVFTGVIGWLINWSGLVMLFSPVRFHGVRVPGMRELATRAAAQAPGGARASCRAASAGRGSSPPAPPRWAASPSTRRSPSSVRRRSSTSSSSPTRSPSTSSRSSEPEIPELVDEVMRREHPRLWRDLPPPVRKARRSSGCRPSCRRWSARVTDEIGVHIDQLLDPKIMVIDHFRENPALVVRIFRDFGQRELNLMVAFGFIFGFLLGIPVAFVDQRRSTSGGCCRCSASSSAGSPTPSACG